MKSLLEIILASAAALITFTVARKILRDQFKIGPPTMIAAIVAALAFLGLTGGGSGLFTVLLLPFEALGVTLLLFPIIWMISRAARFWQRDSCGTQRRGRIKTRQLPGCIRDSMSSASQNQQRGNGWLTSMQDPKSSSLADEDTRDRRSY